MAFRNEKFTVIIGDLINSTSLSTEEKENLNLKISDISARLLRKFFKDFIAPLEIIRGDEISCVLQYPRISYKICREINEEIFPLQFRFVIVRDYLDIGISTKVASKMDGSAFHVAAKKIIISKRKKLHYIFKLGPEYSDFDNFLTTLSNLSRLIVLDWSEHQRLIINKFKLYGSQKKVAVDLNVSQQAVSKTLKRAHWREVEDSNITIDSFLDMPRQNNPQGA